MSFDLFMFLVFLFLFYNFKRLEQVSFTNDGTEAAVFNRSTTDADQLKWLKPHGPAHLTWL